MIVTWTLVLVISMTRGANVEVHVPGFHNLAACTAAEHSYSAQGLSAVVISVDHRCVPAARDHSQGGEG